MMKISQALNLKNVRPLDLEVLLAYVLAKNREWLWAHPEEKISQNNIQKFEKLINTRQKGKPVAYLVNTKEFYGSDFFVNESVLIPRPETELLVEEVIKLKPESLLDVGTGSGCLAIAIAKNLNSCAVSACDISPAALEVARKNAGRHKVKVDFYESDLLGKISGEFEIIVANLPYVPENSTEIQPEVKAHEPKEALFSGADGLDLIQRLLQQIAGLEKKPKFVLLEIGAGQAGAVGEAAKKLFPKSQIEFKKDLAGIERIARIKLG